MLKKRGSWRANTGQAEAEPKPPVASIRPPGTLEPKSEERRVWKDMAPMLVGMGVFTQAERNLLERYCVLWVQWRKATLFIQQNGMTYPITDGAGKLRCFQQFPQVNIQATLSVELRRMEQELGLTPAARTRLRADREQMTKGGEVPGLKKINPFFLVQPAAG